MSDMMDDMEGGEGVVKKFMFVNRKAPHGTVYALEGLEVVTLEGVRLGTVSHLFDTGANPVMVVAGERERLLPFVMDQYVASVDLEGRRITVDWDPEF